MNTNAGGFAEITISAPSSPGGDGEILLDGNPVSLDQLKADLIQRTAAGELKVMIYAERDVKSGFIGEVEQVIGEVAGDTETEIPMSYAVRDRR